MTDEAALTESLATVTAQDTASSPASDAWLVALRNRGRDYDEAVRYVRDLVRRAARQQIARMPHVRAELGAVRAEEIIESAADEATVAVLERLHSFEGRSRFTTWVYKFGVWHAAAEARRALWRDRPLELGGHHAANEQQLTPESYAEARDLSTAVSLAIHTALTPHQRRIVLALIVDGVPIDVLAERLGTSRNTLYKAVHDARVSLRKELLRRGYLRAPAETVVP
ncbi:MAG TPA: sigma-70 family RNA polymerase sigma factor [Jatrophihabitans sp.]|nr:sigma-70 family RNA polymerase sigma factor [Jatrophihabitans sp.]